MDSQAELEQLVHSLGQGELTVHSETSIWYSFRIAHGTGFDAWKQLASRFPASGIAPVIVISEFEDWILDDPANWGTSLEGSQYVDLIHGMEREPITKPFLLLSDVDDEAMYLLPANGWADALEYLPIQLFPTQTMRAIVDHFEAQICRGRGRRLVLSNK